MSESAARQRAAIDLEEFERRLRLPERQVQNDDPLAELARLVGANHDPFKDMHASAHAPEIAHGEYQAQAAQPYPGHPIPAQDLAQDLAQDHAQDHALDPALDDAQAMLRDVAGQMRSDAPYAPPAAAPLPYPGPLDPQAQFEDEVYRKPEPAGFEAGQMPPALAAAMAAAPAAAARTPQMPPAAMPPFIAAQNVPPPPRARSSGGMFGSPKNVALMSGALGVLVVGIGVTLAMKGSDTRASKSAPTILASKDPVKVKPEAGSAEAARGATGAGEARTVRNISLLDKNSGKPAPARVVSREEQPIDLTQAPPAPRPASANLDRKVNLGDRNATRPTASVAGQARAPQGEGYFPEPRRVRTVMVRPDGSIIGPAAAPSAPLTPVAMLATGSTGGPTMNAAATQKPPAARTRPVEPQTPAPDPAAPRATNRATAPAAAPAQVAPRQQAKPAPQRTAAVQPRAAAPRPAATASGGFAVQLAAPGSEAEAKSVASRLRQRFSAELGGRAPSVVRAQVGARTVWRVRVTGLSREAATAMCSKMQGKGGACFVAR